MWVGAGCRQSQHGGSGQKLANVKVAWARVERKGTDPSNICDSGFGQQLDVRDEGEGGRRREDRVPARGLNNGGGGDACHPPTRCVIS